MGNVAKCILEAAENDTPRLEGCHVLQEFRDFFPDEVMGLPPRRNVDLIVEIVSGDAPMSKTPYMMSTVKLLELKMQLQELLEKK